MIKLCDFSKNFIKYIFAVFIVLYSIANILFTVNYDSSSSKALYRVGINTLTLISLVVIAIIMFSYIRHSKREFNSKTLLYTFLFLCFLIGILWILNNDIELKELDDSFNVYHSALSICNGDYSPLSYKTYISNYPNNIGILTYEIISIKLFGEIGSLYSIRIINLLFVLIGYFYLYKITDILFNNNIVNSVLVFLFFCSMQFVFMAFFIYGNCLSYSSAIVSVYYLLKYFKTNKVSCVLISVITIVLSVVIKMNSLIVMIAEIIYLILNLLENRKCINIVFIILVLLGSFVGTTGLQKFWGNKVGIDYDSTKLPTICWIAYGFNYDEQNPGRYTNEFEQFHYENGFVPEYTSIEAKRFINNSINSFNNNPMLGVRFYGEKFLCSWANPQYEVFDQYDSLDKSAFSLSVIKGTGNQMLNSVWDSTQIIISIGLLVYLFKKRKAIELVELLPALIVVGGFLFHSFWEVKAIYLYQYFMFLLPYASYGITLLCSKLINLNRILHI